MSCELEPSKPDGVLYRLARRPDPWAWPDWVYAGEDGTFDNRYDDPRGEYRVLYASSERRAPFVETLACFRADPAIATAGIAGDPRDAEYPTVQAGTVPAGWLEERLLGIARCDAAFADVGHARSLAKMQEELAPVLVSHRLVELDAATIRARAPRVLTKEISRYVYECTMEDGDRAFQGIRYLSRLGDDLTNWALCEPAAIDVVDAEELRRNDPDLVAAVDMFGLVLS